ncbi:MAG TPA: MFS transporter [Anaeromyxobacteraceae bacterium]|nr:MFS transporter [Anaeromyxobacteraceae bacterium]
MSQPATTAAPERLPGQIWYLAWNEAAERFSYYGMSSILTLHMVKNLGLAEHDAIGGYQLFVFAVYAAPLVGALLSDLLWGRYRTILWLSFGYVAGHATIALWEGPAGLVAGCLLIALGAGGIKPCASAFAADQVPARGRLVERVYNLYYWMINLGSFGSTLLIPWLFDAYGPRVAFGVPGVAMALALSVFWLGRGRYVRQPVVRRAPGGGSFAATVRSAGWVALIFAPVAAFWALYFQYGSAWTLQADKMDRVVAGFEISTGQVQTLNATLILLLIPVFSLFVYPAVARLGVGVTPLRKMTAGMFVTVLSFVAAAVVEGWLQAGGRPHVAWQLPQYVFMGVGEVLVSVTALEFAYTQAPPQAKSFIMGLWYLTISAGSLLAAVVARLNRYQGVAYYRFYAWLMLGAAVVFAAVALVYRPVAPAAAEVEAS